MEHIPDTDSNINDNEWLFFLLTCKKLHKISYILYFYFIFHILNMSNIFFILQMERDIIMEDIKYGYIKIKLAELIEEKGISKNKLSHRAEMQRTQINQYCNNTVSRLDTAVLARICTALDCRIEDLLEFVPYEEKSD